MKYSVSLLSLNEDRFRLVYRSTVDLVTCRKDRGRVGGRGKGRERERGERGGRRG